MRRTAGREFSKAIGACNGYEDNFSKIESAKVREEELTLCIFGRKEKMAEGEGPSSLRLRKYVNQMQYMG